MGAAVTEALVWPQRASYKKCRQGFGNRTELSRPTCYWDQGRHEAVERPAKVELGNARLIWGMKLVTAHGLKTDGR
jgi:hypothetical protein